MPIGKGMHLFFGLIFYPVFFNVQWQFNFHKVASFLYWPNLLVDSSVLMLKLFFFNVYKYGFCGVFKKRLDFFFNNKVILRNFNYYFLLFFLKSYFFGNKFLSVFGNDKKFFIPIFLRFFVLKDFSFFKKVFFLRVFLRVFFLEFFFF